MSLANTLKQTNFQFPKQLARYEGKVRDVYNINEDLLVMVTSDRISAFDHILPRAIPYKGQVLNQTAAFFFEALGEDIPNAVVDVPDPNVTVALKCNAYPVEMVVRGYLAGHAWRVYRDGGRMLCGVPLPDGLKENDPLPEPIVTPSTKSQIGHDEDISEAEIIKSGLVPADEYAEMKHYTLELYRKGHEMAKERGLILVDAKYEFGYHEYTGRIFLIDEIHTPDSARYFYLDGYEERQAAGEPQKQLSKEFMRQWLIENGFQGLDGQQMPTIPDEIVEEVSNRYIEVYELLTGKTFNKADTNNMHERIEQNVVPVIEKIYEEE